MTELHNMTMEELEEERERCRAEVEHFQKEVDAAQEDLACAEDELEDIEDEIKQRAEDQHAEDRRKLDEWNAAVASAKQAGGAS